MNNERTAVLEVEVKCIREDVSEIKADIKLLLNERHESIGKKSVWGIMYGAAGALIVSLIEWFK